MSGVTGTWSECLYASTGVGATAATFAVETPLNPPSSGMTPQAHLPPDFWLPNQGQVGRGIHIIARGVLGTTTVAPTFTFTIRGGAVGNVASTPILLGSAATTVALSQTAVLWEIEGDVILTATGAVGVSTLRGMGHLLVQQAVSPFTLFVPMWGGGASPGTDAHLDITNPCYINVNVNCGTSNAANTVTLDQLLVFGLN
jgi:hypothetical protein